MRPTSAGARCRARRTEKPMASARLARSVIPAVTPSRSTVARGALGPAPGVAARSGVGVTVRIAARVYFNTSDRTALANAKEDEGRVPRVVARDRCPCCASEERTQMFSRPDYYMGVPGDYAYAACRGCGSVYQAPMVDPADVALCYPGSYYTHSRGPESHGRARPLAGVRDKLRTAVQALAGSRPDAAAGLACALVADPGGSRARVLRPAGGTDPAIQRRTRARSRDGCREPVAAAVPSRLGRRGHRAGPDCGSYCAGRHQSAGPQYGSSESNLEPGAYELVVLSHVFEHLVDPVAALSHLGECLSARGRIVLIYPNLTSLAAHSFGPDWIHWDPPRHLFLPSGGGLRAAVARTLRRPDGPRAAGPLTPPGGAPPESTRRPGPPAGRGAAHRGAATRPAARRPLGPPPDLRDRSRIPCTSRSSGSA